LIGQPFNCLSILTVIDLALFNLAQMYIFVYRWPLWTDRFV